MIRHALVMPGLVMLAAGLGGGASRAATLEITFTNTQPTGKVFGQIFADAPSFTARQKPMTRFTVEPGAGGIARSTIELPPGRYAVTAFQDTKGTGKIETGMLGRPTVPFGFSNDASATFGPPGFEAAAFDLGEGGRQIKIRMR